MRKIRFGIALLAVVISLTAGRPLLGNCNEGRRVMAVQNSDIRLEPGIATYLTVRVMTLDIPFPPSSMPADCGLYAKSELPGLSIISAYGVSPSETNPPGVWTGIGESYSATPVAQPWGNTLSNAGVGVDIFSILVDGKTPAGTQGRILLGVKRGGETDTDVLYVPIGAINVYVGYPTPTPTWFTVTSNVRNVSRHKVALDHRLLNGNPSAKLFVAHVVNPRGFTPRHWNHPIMTSYDGDIGQWVINNADGATMPLGLGFNVRIDASALQLSTGRPEFNPPVRSVEINDPIADGNPYATIAVSMTGGRAVNAHPVAVQYTGARWCIINSDGALIPAGARFNVKVIGFSAYHQALTPNRLDLFISNAAGISAVENASASPVPLVPNARLLHFWWQLGHKPTFPMLVTPNQNPMGLFAQVTGKYVGLTYVDGIKPRWSVVHEDRSAVPLEAAFNVFGQPQPLVP